MFDIKINKIMPGDLLARVIAWLGSRSAIASATTVTSTTTTAAATAASSHAGTELSRTRVGHLGLWVRGRLLGTWGRRDITGCVEEG